MCAKCHNKRHHFNPLPPCGGRRVVGCHSTCERYAISIHSLRVEGDPQVHFLWHTLHSFQSTPSVWRETLYHGWFYKYDPFQSTPSVWRETLLEDNEIRKTIISIHSLRVEGDDNINSFCYRRLISIHSLRVEGDCDFRRSCIHAPQFQSTPSVWRETDFVEPLWRLYVFQSTPSVWRETANAIRALTVARISIHSLRVEGDGNPNSAILRTEAFQSTPSVWRETSQKKHLFYRAAISIHSLRVEGDQLDNPR